MRFVVSMAKFPPIFWREWPDTGCDIAQKRPRSMRRGTRTSARKKESNGFLFSWACRALRRFFKLGSRIHRVNNRAFAAHCAVNDVARLRTLGLARLCVHAVDFAAQTTQNGAKAIVGAQVLPINGLTTTSTSRHGAPPTASRGGAMAWQTTARTSSMPPRTALRQGVDADACIGQQTACLLLLRSPAARRCAPRCTRTQAVPIAVPIAIADGCSLARAIRLAGQDQTTHSTAPELC